MFHSSEDRKPFVSKNSKFFEDNYANNYKSKGMVVIEEMSNARASKCSKLFGDEVVVLGTPRVVSDEIPSTIIPHPNGEIIKTFDRFMFLGEPCEAISKEPELNPRTYDKAVSDVDANR